MSDDKKESLFVVCFRLSREVRKSQKKYYSAKKEDPLKSTYLIESREAEKALDLCITEIENAAKQKGMTI